MYAKRITHTKPLIFFGGDYNPDQWDEKIIDQDLRLFKEANINLVTLPVFSWAKLEPSEGVYNFEWLDKIIDKLWQNNIYVCLATPTAAQPAWLSAKYPEVLPTDIAGRRRTHGMRVFFCVNSEKYRERAAAITRQMCDRYKDHPALAAWHVANEYGTYCYCENCQKKFRLWLKDRYKNIETLNEKWNLAFWGRTVYSFEEIMLPTELNDDYRFQPAVQLDYMRFVTASTIDCYLNEANILKKATPHIPVFSNMSGYIKKLDQYRMNEYMDYAGWDNYPAPHDEPSFPAMKLDLVRSLKNGGSFFVTEQSPNQQNWQPYNKLKRPGEIRTIAYQGLAHGADTNLFFQMRQSVSGQEKFHGAVISHAGTNDTRIYREMAAMGQELKNMGDLFKNAETQSEVAFLFDWESWWALENCSGPTQDIDLLKQIHHYYKAFFQNHISVDFVWTQRDFSKYKVIVLPLLYIISEDTALRLEAFVANGGTLIGTYRTGVADENDRCIHGAYPGLLRQIFGLWVEETDALYPEEYNEIHVADRPFDTSHTLTPNGTSIYRSSFLCDILRLTTAREIAVYGKDFYTGTPCLTVNQYGKGQAFYIATQPDSDFLAGWILSICKDASVSLPAVKAGSPNVEITSRSKNGRHFIFIINHCDEPVTVDLGDNYYNDHLSAKQLAGQYALAPRGCLILTACAAM